MLVDFSETRLYYPLPPNNEAAEYAEVLLIAEKLQPRSACSSYCRRIPSTKVELLTDPSQDTLATTAGSVSEQNPHQVREFRGSLLRQQYGWCNLEVHHHFLNLQWIYLCIVRRIPF